MKKLFLLTSCLTLLSLVLSSCAPAAAPAPAPKQTAAVPAPQKPAAQATTAAPAATPKPAGDEPRYGGILKQAAYRDEATFDLHTAGRSLVADQAGPGFSGLLQYDPRDGRKVMPDLAESYEISADGKKVTFRLRKNVKWHDGKPFTSEDVKFNFDRWMKPPEGVIITRKEIAAPVDRVETPDASTVEVYLKYPSPFFIAGIALISAAMLPPQYLKDHKTMEYTVLGTGPFKLKKYVRSVSVEFVKNADYFIPGRPYLDGFVQYMLPDRTARFAAFRTGQVVTMYTSSHNLTASSSELLRREMSDKVGVARFPGMVIGLVYMNVTRPPFNDLRVRQAVDMALDRKKVMDVVEGRGEITGPMMQGAWGLSADELLKRPGYRGVTAGDVERAKALLAEAGHPRGFPAEAMIYDAYTAQMSFVQDQLKAIGIDVQIKMVDTATMEKRYLARDYALSVYLPGQPIDEPDLYLTSYVTGGGRNYTGFQDKQIDDWYKEQSQTMDVAKRKEIVVSIQRKILDLAPVAVLYHHLYESPYWKTVRGFYPEKQLGGFNNVKRQDIWLAK
ncbi:MAG: ABC transporter substrate-binding protein [Chloroflexi bacterium]|nr:ABC transporter substrate-binding protein [Chloroflexota bacterium]